MRKLGSILQDVPLTEEAKRDILKKAMHLNFPQKYLPMNPDSVSKALQLICSMDDVPFDMPIHPSMLFTENKAQSVLAAFGYNAPSFMIPNSPLCALDGAFKGKHLTVRSVPLATAFVDYGDMVQMKAIRNNPVKLSSLHQDVKIKSPLDSVVWESLKKIVATAPVVNVNVGQGNVVARGAYVDDF
jgi:hypothetical protein